MAGAAWGDVMDDVDKLYRDQLIDRLHVAETNCRNAEACWRNAERDLERVDRKWDKALAERDEARAALKAMRAERDSAIVGRDEARAVLLDVAKLLDTAERERDEARDALAPLVEKNISNAAYVEALDAARALVKAWEAK